MDFTCHGRRTLHILFVFLVVFVASYVYIYGFYTDLIHSPLSSFAIFNLSVLKRSVIFNRSLSFRNVLFNRSKNFLDALSDKFDRHAIKSNTSIKIDPGNNVPYDPLGEISLTKKTNKIIRILFWTPSYGKPFRFYNITKPNRCITTNDRAELTESDAVIFHLWDIKGIDDLPKSRSASQKWFLYNMEPPIMTKEIGKFDGIFNATISYRFNSDIFTPYGYLKARSSNSPTPNFDIARKKSRLAAWFVSSCSTQSKRDVYAAELQKHMDIDIYGKCGTFQCKKFTASCYEMLRATYKFYLAFENSLCMDYITEKVWEYMRHDVILVVMGAGNYVRMLPKHSYIDAHEFESPARLAEYLNRVAADDALYNSYFEWKKQYEVVLYKQYEVANGICDYMHRTKYFNESTVRTGLLKWWDQCFEPKDFYKNMGIKISNR